jgi:hypothetical protein
MFSLSLGCLISPRMDTSQIDALIAEGYRVAKERVERIRAVLERPSAS